MIEISNNRLRGIYKDGNEVVKIYNNYEIVYQKLNIVDPYTNNGVFYHKKTGECEINRSSANNNDYDGVVVSKDNVVRGIRLYNMKNGSGSVLNSNVTTPFSITEPTFPSNVIEMTWSLQQDVEVYGASFTMEGSSFTSWNWFGYTATAWLSQIDNNQRCGFVTDEILAKGDYLPSVQELNLMAEYLTEVNLKISNLGGVPLGNYNYWCSSVVYRHSPSSITCAVVNPTTGTMQLKSWSDRCIARPFFTVVPPAGTYYYEWVTAKICKDYATIQPSGIVISDGERMAIMNIQPVGINFHNDTGQDFRYGGDKHEKPLATSSNDGYSYSHVYNTGSSTEQLGQNYLLWGKDEQGYGYGIPTTYNKANFGMLSQFGMAINIPVSIHDSTVADGDSTMYGMPILELCRLRACYLPSLDQLKFIADHIEEVNAAYKKLKNADKYLHDVFASSTLVNYGENNTDYAWAVFLDPTSYYNGQSFERLSYVQSHYEVLPFCYY